MDTRHDLAALREIFTRTRPGSDEFSASLRSLETRHPDDAEAATLLGHVYLQNPQLPESAQRAYQAYARAELQGDAAASERLADLELSGRLETLDDAGAYARLRALADRGVPSAQCDVALLLDAGLVTDESGATSTHWYLRAAMQGWTLGLYIASLRLRDHDAVTALALMQLAKLRSFPLAEPGLEILSARSVDDEAVAQRIEVLKARIRGLGERLKDVSPDIDVTQTVDQALELAGLLTFSNVKVPVSVPPEFCIRSELPRVLVSPNFATLEECAHLVESAVGRLVSTEQAIQSAQSIVEVDAFHGDAALFPQSVYTPAMRIVQRRFADCLQRPTRAFEPLSVLRYGLDSEYSLHVDYFSESRMAAHRTSGDHGGQREMTCLIYLRVPEAGGDTFYPEPGLTVSGEPGLALIHYNVLPDGQCDGLSKHAGTPITAGEKWLARTAVRRNLLY